MMAKRLKTGDVLRVNVGEGAAYLQYLGRHPIYGDGILVGRLRPAERLDITADLLAHSYFTFYPATAALKQGLVNVVGNLPARPIPARMRRAGAMEGNQVRTWIIEEAGRDTVKPKLTGADAALPIVEICNHEALVGKIQAAWDPTQETGEPYL